MNFGFNNSSFVGKSDGFSGPSFNIPSSHKTPNFGNTTGGGFSEFNGFGSSSFTTPLTSHTPNFGKTMSGSLFTTPYTPSTPSTLSTPSTYSTHSTFTSTSTSSVHKKTDNKKNFTPQPRHYMSEYTFGDCKKSCKVQNEPMAKCGTTTANPYNLTFNEQFNDAHCVLKAKKDEKKCIDRCKTQFKKK